MSRTIIQGTRDLSGTTFSEAISLAAARPVTDEPSWFTRRYAPARRADDYRNVQLSAHFESPLRQIYCLACTGRLSEVEFDALWLLIDAA